MNQQSKLNYNVYIDIDPEPAPPTFSDIFYNDDDDDD